VSSAVMTGIEGESDTKTKDEESGDIWCEASESKTHSNVTYLKNYEATDLWKKK